MTLVNEMIKYIDGDIKIIHAYYDNISPCVDCRFCWNNEGCCIYDDMQEVYKLLDEVDNVIISSPLYFSQLTGKLLSFASRLQTFFVRRCIKKDSGFKHKKKNGVLIITGGGDGSPNPAVASANIIFRHINANLIGTIFSLETNDIPAKENVEAMSRAKEISLHLNKLNRE